MYQYNSEFTRGLYRRGPTLLTYRSCLFHVARENTYAYQGKRLFIKDIIHYLVPPKGQPAMIAPSISPHKRGVGTENGLDSIVNGDSVKAEHYPWTTPTEDHNPTVIPKALMEQFHWMFLIRDPHRAIPSYYRCTIPPLDKVTGFYNFDPSEAGYIEVRLVFDYLRRIGAVGPHFAPGKTNGATEANSTTKGDIEKPGSAEICVIDADDMLDYPAKYIEAVCTSVGIPYTPDMLNWDNEIDQHNAREAFEKWAGFHDDAIASTCLYPRDHKNSAQSAKPEEEWDKEWLEKYGPKGAKIIRETVDACMDDYLYMKTFALKLY